MKTCTACLKEKVLECFDKKKDSKDGRRSICKECRKIKYQESKTPCPECSKPIQKTSSFCRSCFQKGKRNHQWRGEVVRYQSLHKWVRRNKEKTPCKHCGSNKVEAANISQEYKRDLDDFMWLCRSCHLKYDIKCGVRRLPQSDELERIDGSIKIKCSRCD